MKVALYARVSTKDKEQNPEVQLAALREYCHREDWEIFSEYVDKTSAMDHAGRKEWTRLMKDASLRKFDKVLVWRLDRAFRDVGHSVTTMQLLDSYGVGFRSISDLPLDISGPFADFYRTVRVAFAQLERATIVERINDGIRHAKLHGTKSGRPIGRKPKDIDFTIVSKALKSASTEGHPVHYSEASRIITKQTGINVSPGLVYLRIFREAESQGKSMKDILDEILSIPMTD